MLEPADTSNVPAAHDEHELAPAVEYLPEVHGPVTAERPVVAQYEPYLNSMVCQQQKNIAFSKDGWFFFYLQGRRRTHWSPWTLQISLQRNLCKNWRQWQKISLMHMSHCIQMQSDSSSCRIGLRHRPCTGWTR